MDEFLRNLLNSYLSVTTDNDNADDLMQDYLSKVALGVDVTDHQLSNVYLPIYDANKSAGNKLVKISLATIIKVWVTESGSGSGSSSSSGSGSGSGQTIFIVSGTEGGWKWTVVIDNNANGLVKGIDIDGTGITDQSFTGTFDIIDEGAGIFALTSIGSVIGSGGVLDGVLFSSLVITFTTGALSDPLFDLDGTFSDVSGKIISA